MKKYFATALTLLGLSFTRIPVTVTAETYACVGSGVTLSAARDVQVLATSSIVADTSGKTGSIGVLNACRTKDGSMDQSQGVARPVEGHPSRLEVRFAPDWLSWLPAVWADYWVIALDPDYQWAMVGEPGRDYLWILSREPSMDRALFEQLKSKAEGMGYDLSPLVMAAPLK